MDIDLKQACVDDCAYAACLLTIAKLEAVAAGQIASLQGDLLAFASALKTPSRLEDCANAVRNAEAMNELATLDLGEGESSSLLWGHVKSAKVTLGCALDDLEPYVLDPEVMMCTEPANIPQVTGEQPNDGPVVAGEVIMTGSAQASGSLYAASFAFTEQQCSRSTCGFALTALDGRLTDMSAQGYTLRDTVLHLAAPAMGRIEGEAVYFPARAIHLEVDAVVEHEGELLNEGRPYRFDYWTTHTATATRSLDGDFSIDMARFDLTDELSAVLRTEPSPWSPTSP